jgi:hypothetical protein
VLATKILEYLQPKDTMMKLYQVCNTMALIVVFSDIVPWGAYYRRILSEEYGDYWTKKLRPPPGGRSL